MADKMFDLLPPLDVSDPRAFIAATAAIFAAYPREVWAAVADPVRGIPGKTARPTLADIKKACDEAYAPFARAFARAKALAQLPPPSPPPRTAEEQESVDGHVAAVRQQFGIPPQGLKR